MGLDKQTVLQWPAASRLYVSFKGLPQDTLCVDLIQTALKRTLQMSVGSCGCMRNPSALECVCERTEAAVCVAHAQSEPQGNMHSSVSVSPAHLQNTGWAQWSFSKQIPLAESCQVNLGTFWNILDGAFGCKIVTSAHL
ncbi:hypothetical protein E1301_Tti009325 [Triplophysa tibetana]|uniref:Uncharacterized protein n=1 Tax=Triplophysa tibetana TaxID=1572043 RepID=A0A5A9NVN0_9TELE|nr:hypothetical protein E1301_Tti009325 [Triplophysa tibetana]